MDTISKISLLAKEKQKEITFEGITDQEKYLITLKQLHNLKKRRQKKPVSQLK